MIYTSAAIMPLIGDWVASLPDVGGNKPTNKKRPTNLVPPYRQFRSPVRSRIAGSRHSQDGAWCSDRLAKSRRSAPSASAIWLTLKIWSILSECPTMAIESITTALASATALKYGRRRTPKLQQTK